MVVGVSLVALCCCAICAAAVCGSNTFMFLQVPLPSLPPSCGKFRMIHCFVYDIHLASLESPWGEITHPHRVLGNATNNGVTCMQRKRKERYLAGRRHTLEALCAAPPSRQGSDADQPHPGGLHIVPAGASAAGCNIKTGAEKRESLLGVYGLLLEARMAVRTRYLCAAAVSRLTSRLNTSKVHDSWVLAAQVGQPSRCLSYIRC